jgi:hypothetical protein
MIVLYISCLDSALINFLQKLPDCNILEIFANTFKCRPNEFSGTNSKKRDKQAYCQLNQKQFPFYYGQMILLIIKCGNFPMGNSNSVTNASGAKFFSVLEDINNLDLIKLGNTLNYIFYKSVNASCLILACKSSLTKSILNILLRFILYQYP